MTQSNSDLKQFYPKLDQGKEFPYLVMERGEALPVARFREIHLQKKALKTLNGEKES